MSLAKTLTTFLIDISPSMGRSRTVVDEVVRDDGQVEQIQRETTNLSWVLEFVNRKTQEVIFSSLKTAKMSLVTFGSTRTANVVTDEDEEQEGYQGIDEIAPMGQPTVATLEVLRAMRAVKEDEGGHAPDPLDALIVALTAMTDTSRGGEPSSARSWKRTIYLITDASQPMNTESLEAIASRIKDDRVSLKVIGIDFDDDEYGEEKDKSEVKTQNERWWHNWLSTLPDSAIATAARALDQAVLPSVTLKSSAPYKTTLTFGDPEKQHGSDTIMSIPVRMYKLTNRALPMSRKTMSKHAEQTESARKEKEATQQFQSQFLAPTPTPKLPTVDASGQTINTYSVGTRHLYFLAAQKEEGLENAQPLEYGSEQAFGRAYKLGASLIPVDTEDVETQWISSAGLEIINFFPALGYDDHKQAFIFGRHLLMGEVWNVFAEASNLKGQVQLSSLAKALKEQNKMALVRFVRRNDAEPKLGVLYPVVRDEQSSAEYFHFAELPFRNDVRRYVFPSLDRVVMADGKEVREHRILPNDKMLQSMEKLVDSMDLMRTFKDEEGNQMPWFSTEDSFNPGIHRMKEAVAYRVLHPESKDLPRPHWEVDKFLDRPSEIREASQSWVDECSKLFNVRYQPTSSLLKAQQKRSWTVAEKAKKIQARYELDLGGVDPDAEAQNGETAEAASASTANGTNGEDSKRARVSEAQSASVRGRLIEDDSGTEDEDEMLKPSQPALSNAQGSANGRVAEPEIKQEPDTRVIRILPADPVGSLLFHLDDPRLDQGNVLRALHATIVDLVNEKPSPSGTVDPEAQRWTRAKDALKAGKTAASEYDEAELWNDWIEAFKTTCLDQDHQGWAELATLDDKLARRFWLEMCKGDTAVGLVTKEEDEGQRSVITREDADAFVA